MKVKIKIAKIKQRLSTLKVSSKLRFLKKCVKPLKYLLPAIFLTYPLSSYAVEVNNVEENTCPNTKSAALKHLVLSLIGIAKCKDPSATTLQKVIYCARPCCMVAGLTSGYVSEFSTPGSRVHKFASLCCASSWSAYSFLVFFDPEKLKTKNNK
jgi:hypothetical protein